MGRVCRLPSLAPEREQVSANHLPDVGTGGLLVSQKHD